MTDFVYCCIYSIKGKKITDKVQERNNFSKFYFLTSEIVYPLPFPNISSILHIEVWTENLMRSSRCDGIFVLFFSYNLTRGSYKPFPESHHLIIIVNKNKQKKCSFAVHIIHAYVWVILASCVQKHNSPCFDNSSGQSNITSI